MITKKVEMKVIAGVDDAGNNIYKKRTIKNLRPEISDDQIREYVARYCSLTSDILVETVVVETRVLEDKDEVTPEVENVEVAKEVADVIPEEKIPEKELEAESLQMVEQIREEGVEAEIQQEVERYLEKVEEKASPQEHKTIPEKELEVELVNISTESQKQFVKSFPKKRMSPPVKRGSKTSKKKWK